MSHSSFVRRTAFRSAASCLASAVLPDPGNPQVRISRASLTSLNPAVLAGWNSLDVYVLYLRRKLEEHGGQRLIHTVRGVGYTLRVA